MVFGPVAAVTRFSDLDEAVALATDSEYGLALGILGDVSTALALADRIPTGIVHINDQTVDDEAVAPFGGRGASGTGARFGGPAANIEAFTETQWLTMQGAIAPYPFWRLVCTHRRPPGRRTSRAGCPERCSRPGT